MTVDLLGNIDYPKTSCNCSECPAIPSPQTWPNENFADGSSNNLGLRDEEQLREIENCVSVNSVTRSKVPIPWLKNDKYKILNKNFGLDFAPGFYKDPNVGCECPQNPPGHTNVTSSDPSTCLSSQRTYTSFPRSSSVHW